MTPPTTDGEIDRIVEYMAFCIGESKSERRDDTSQIFDDMKVAINQEIQKQVVAAKIEQIKRIKRGASVLDKDGIMAFLELELELNKLAELDSHV
jgi:hypothetical protein